MTVTLVDVFLFILTAAVVVAVVFMVRLAQRLTRVAGETEELVRHMNYLRPQMENLVKEAEGELEDLRSLTRRLDGVVEDVGSITHVTSRIATPALSNVAALAVPMKYASAALTGAKIGMQVLRSRARKKSEED